MFIRDDEKDLHKAALDKLLESVVHSGIGEKLSKLRKPVAASMIIEKPDDDETDLDDLDDEDEERPSDEDLAEMQRKVRKFCHGGEV